MADGTHIEWCDATWPVVQGCDYESPGCTHCYAVPLLWRMAHHPNPKISAPLQGLVEKHANGKPAFTGKLALREDRLDWPLRWPGGKKIFLPSHGDLFHPGVPRWFQDRVFAVIAFCGAATPPDTFILLTKRPKAFREYLEDIIASGRTLPLGPDAGYGGIIVKGPIKNLWGLTSVERQQEADERIPEILAAPLAVRGISAEPLLGPVDLTRLCILPQKPGSIRAGIHVDALRNKHCESGVPRGLGPLNWVITGGESGPGARGALRAWFQSIRDQCQAAGVAYFHKQNGEFIDANEWFDRVTKYGAIHRHDAIWAPPRPLNYEDADALAEMTARRGRVEHHSDGSTLIRVDKRAAGCRLNGKEHSEFPA